MKNPALGTIRSLFENGSCRISLGHFGVVLLFTFVCLPILPAGPTLVWSGVIIAAAAFETLACRAVEARPSDRRRALALSSTVLISTIYAITFAGLLARGDSSAKLFALVMITSSMTFVLLRYHSRPWSFVIAILPQMGILAFLGLIIAAGPAARGQYLQAATPIATSVLLILTFWAARRELAGSWKAIVARERAADAASQAKSAFLATMSHEIRTPLNGVLGMAQAMTHDDLADVQRERLKVIRRSGESLLAILDDVLDLSKIEAGKLELEMSEFGIEHLVRGAAANFSPMARQNGVDFQFEVADEARGVWRGDALRIRQIVYNLVSNAVKFTREGQVAIAVTAAPEGLRLSVADTGVGIAPEDMARLFDKFVQGDSSATRRYGGAGLGLTICQELAHLMGGEITVDSQLGKGSVFTITLPLERVAKVAPAPQPAAPQPEPAANLRVLAAEDNRINQMVLKTLLAQAGIEVTLVEDGARCVEAWEGGQWDIVLMDIQMPEMDGVAATRAIRGREAQTGRPRTPIVAVTANAMVHQVAEYSAAGMDGMVAKPIEIAALFAAMEAALDGPSPDQAAQAATA